MGETVMLDLRIQIDRYLLIPYAPVRQRLFSLWARLGSHTNLCCVCVFLCTTYVSVCQFASLPEHSTRLGASVIIEYLYEWSSADIRNTLSSKSLTMRNKQNFIKFTDRNRGYNCSMLPTSITGGSFCGSVLKFSKKMHKVQSLSRISY